MLLLFLSLGALPLFLLVSHSPSKFSILNLSEKITYNCIWKIRWEILFKIMQEFGLRPRLPWTIILCVFYVIRRRYDFKNNPNYFIGYINNSPKFTMINSMRQHHYLSSLPLCFSQQFSSFICYIYNSTNFASYMVFLHLILQWTKCSKFKVAYSPKWYLMLGH